jgi:hypothetical protein
MGDPGTPIAATVPTAGAGARAFAAWLGRMLRISVPICLLTSAFLSVALRDPFADTLVYALCIGLSIQLLGEGARHVLGRWRHARQPMREGIGPRWPGWDWMAPVIVGSTVAGYWFGITVADAIVGRVRPEGVFAGGGRALLIVLPVCLAVSLSAVYFFHSRARLALLRERSERAEREAGEAQLRLLQSQLEPHMLFNTLANLRVLVGSDPPRAQAMLDRLIAFLRATLAASRRVSHPLADEFERLGDYLALMAVRMGDRLQFELDLPEALRSTPVPTLLLQPLVENSIRHGLEPQLRGGRISVRARRDGDALVLTVRDTGLGLHGTAIGADAAGSGRREAATPGTGGFGLQQVRERLAGAYGSRAGLTLETAADAEGGTLATLRLPRPGP